MTSRVMTVSVLGSLGMAWCASVSLSPTGRVVTGHGGHQHYSATTSEPGAGGQYIHDSDCYRLRHTCSVFPMADKLDPV